MNQMLRMPLNATRESHLEAALGAFYTPRVAHSELVIVEYRDPMSHLARRFFHLLLRSLPSFPITLIPHYPHSPLPSFPITLIPHYPHSPLPSFPITLIPHYPHSPLPSFPITLIPHYPHSPLPSFPIALVPHYPHSPLPSFVSLQFLICFP